MNKFALVATALELLTTIASLPAQAGPLSHRQAGNYSPALDPRFQSHHRATLQSYCPAGASLNCISDFARILPAKDCRFFAAAHVKPFHLSRLD